MERIEVSMGFIGHHRLILGRFGWGIVRPGDKTGFERKCFTHRITHGICDAMCEAFQRKFNRRGSPNDPPTTLGAIPIALSCGVEAIFDGIPDCSSGRKRTRRRKSICLEYHKVYPPTHLVPPLGLSLA